MLGQIRNFFFELLKFVIYGNLLVAFGAYSLSIFLFNSDPHLLFRPLSLFIFFSTLFTYNFHRRVGKELHRDVPNSASIQWMISHPILSRSITLISFAAAVYFLMDLPKSTYFLIAPLALISLTYVINFSDKLSLRQIPFLKIFLISLSWSIAIVLIPFEYVKALSDKSPIFPFFAIFFFMIAEIIPFDIRDMRLDQSTDLKTIPNYFGLKTSILIALSCLVLSNLFFLFAIDFNFSSTLFIIWVLSSIFLSIFILASYKSRSDLYYSLLIESSLSLPFLFSFLMA